MPSLSMHHPLAIGLLLAFCAGATHAQTTTAPYRDVASVDITQQTQARAHVQDEPLARQEEPQVGEEAPSATAATAQPEPAPELAVRVINVGSATENLLALQRASQGVRPRPIDGEQASRSYQRYLKSFETPIPERFDTGLEVKQ